MQKQQNILLVTSLHDAKWAGALLGAILSQFPDPRINVSTLYLDRSPVLDYGKTTITMVLVLLSVNTLAELHSLALPRPWPQTAQKILVKLRYCDHAGIEDLAELNTVPADKALITRDEADWGVGVQEVLLELATLMLKME